jgi:hypothetical protein
VPGNGLAANQTNIPDATILSNVTMKINNNGNVGIGTINPQANLQVIGKTIIGVRSITGQHGNYQLAVDGKIVTTKLIVTEVGWADDELTNTLTLDSLQNEELFVLNYGHLKGMPSGKEVETNGIDFSLMSSLQMRKIERLYKYSFLFNKIIYALQDENKVLQNNNNELNKQNEVFKKQLNDLNKRITNLENK